MYIIYFLIFLVVVFLLKFYEPIIKGKIGEFKVAIILSFLNKDKYKVINDIILPTENGSTQIDHIVLSEYGIFVIETKNYKGWIYGNEFANEWTKNMYGKKYKFQNPLKQNFGHIKTLSNLLSIDENMFISIIVFPFTSHIKSEYKNNVTYFLRVNKTIKKYKEIIVDNLEEKYNSIISADINNKENRKQHVKNVKKRINEVKYNICPDCGGNLVKKKGKYGYFTGCLNYPECKYIKKK